MKNKKSTFLILLILVLVLGGAYFLYSRLSGGASGQLQVSGEAAETPPEEPPAEEPEEDGGEDPATPETAEEPETEEPPAEENTGAEDSTEEEPAEDTPIEAPDFQFYDRDGTEVQLSDYFGKPIVLNFWASWCGPCKSEMPGFEAKYQALSEDVQFLMVNVTDGFQETQDSASSFIDEQGYTFPVFYDLDAAGARAYSVYGLPATYFISTEGHVIARASGAISEDLLQQGIDMILPPA